MPKEMTKTEWAKTQYHSTTVGVFQSQGAIMGLLKQHLGVRKVGFVEFMGGGGGVIFEWQDHQYRFDAIPIKVMKSIEKEAEAAERQVWRWLHFHVKDMIGAALFMPIEDMLLPYMLVAPGEQEEEPLTLGEAIRKGKAHLELPPGQEI